ncbi:MULTISPECIES: class III lanthipeptide [Kitasatospora]|nr:class III lanthipeptide [Kitasatospora xanthocidica]
MSVLKLQNIEARVKMSAVAVLSLTSSSSACCKPSEPGQP